MGSEWASVTIEELAAASENALATGPFGSRIGSRFFVESGVPVIRGSNLCEDTSVRLKDDGLVFLSPEKAREFARSTVHDGDLVFTCWGTVDQVGLVDRRATFREYVISNKQMKLTPDPSRADSLFLYYLFSSRDVRAQIRARAIGSSVPGFNLGQLRGIRIGLPPLREQRRIARILGTLDDKIELNRKMSEMLEAMARALFKSWFVDFDPVRAKMEGRWRRGQSLPGLPAHLNDLFPDHLVDSELGEIPEGWEVVTFGDVVEQLRDNANPLESPNVVFRHFSIPAFDRDQWPKAELGESIKSQKSRVLPGVVLLSKLNPEIERVWLVGAQADDWAVCSTEFLVLRPRPPHARSYAYCLARSPGFRQQLEGLVTGTSKSHQRAPVGSILGLGVVRPPDPLPVLFERTAWPLLERTLGCRREARILSALRNTLLPRLIAGDLRVKDIAGFLDDVVTEAPGGQE